MTGDDAAARRAAYLERFREQAAQSTLTDDQVERLAALLARFRLEQARRRVARGQQAAS